MNEVISKSEAQRASTEETEPAPLFGVLAEYDTPGQLLKAARAVRDAGYDRWDTFTPFPVHGIDRAMGIKMTVLPWIVLGAGLTGLTTAILLQWWTNAYDYPFIVSGKPFWSIPANVPIMFEMTVLFSAITSLVGMLMLNGLPHPSHPLDLKERFARVTDDKFFLLIQADDPKFDEAETRELLESTTPSVLDDVPEDRVTPDSMPKGISYALIVLAVASLVPFALFAKSRETRTSTPRLHAVADMDWQPKYKAQRANTFFADGRAEREPVPGTVAVGELNEDDHFHRGKLGSVWALTFPSQVTIDQPTMLRGQERFGVFCAPCHGMTGAGDGMVSRRAEALQQGTWIPPTNLNQDYLREQPVGELFNTITHGIRNMPPYGEQIKPQDRWAIVLYMRALQRRTAASLTDLTPAERGSL
jgi:mono/diheme cytochrome c family protein